VRIGRSRLYSLLCKFLPCRFIVQFDALRQIPAGNLRTGKRGRVVGSLFQLDAPNEARLRWVWATHGSDLGHGSRSCKKYRAGFCSCWDLDKNLRACRTARSREPGRRPRTGFMRDEATEIACGGRYTRPSQRKGSWLSLTALSIVDHG
jgi:hypothetical protein